jgi:tetratricopeptide (TPR) repeat protein
MEPAPRSRRRFVGACIAAVLLFAAAYANSLDNAFNFDDGHVIEQNLFIRDLANIPRFFTDARTFSALPQNATYRPVLSVTLAVDYWLAGGLTPRVYHVSQLLFFALLGVLIAVFYRRLFARCSDGEPVAWIALFAATLYCVHTGNTQVGNYVSARSEILCAIGVVAAFLLYEFAPRARRFHLYLVPVVIGALAKNPAVVFAPLLLAYKLLIEEQLSAGQVFSRAAWPRVRRAMFASLPAFVLGALLFVGIERMNPPGQNYGGPARAQYLATQAWMWVRYVRMYFVPTGLSVDTDIAPFASMADPRTIAGVLFLVASLAAVAWASRRRETRPVAFGLLWYWIGIAPTSSIFPLAEVTNDHRPFLGFIGLNAAVVWLAWTLLPRAARHGRALRATPAVMVAILLAHAVGTRERNKDWRDDESLWADVVKKSPANGRGIMNYGLAQMRRGRYVEARDLFLRAQEKLPNYSFLEVNLGVVDAAMGNPVGAEPHFRRAIALDEVQPSVHRFYARFLVDQGRAPEAIEQLRRTLALSPGETDARHLLMAIYAAQGDTAGLQALVTETLAIMRTDPDAEAYARGSAPAPSASDTYQGWFDLGLSFTNAGRNLQAAQSYRMALARDSSQADAWNNLGFALGKLGFFGEAVPALERAIRLRPAFQLARNNLAWVRGELARH